MARVRRSALAAVVSLALAGCAATSDERSWEWTVETCSTEHGGAAGIVTNASSTPSASAFVQVAWYNADGLVVDNTQQRIPALPPGESARFSTAAPFSESAIECEVFEVDERLPAG